MGEDLEIYDKFIGSWRNDHSAIGFILPLRHLHMLRTVLSGYEQGNQSMTFIMLELSYLLTGL